MAANKHARAKYGDAINVHDTDAVAASERANELLKSELVPRIEVIANPSFSAALKFMLLGAALGVGITYLLTERNNSARADARVAEREAQLEAARLETRVGKIARRATLVAKQARVAAGFAATTLAPAVSAALASGREAARDLEQDLKRDLKRDEDDLEQV